MIKLKLTNILTCVFIVFLLILLIVIDFLKNEAKLQQENKNVIITADHIDTLEGYKKVYTFEDRDAAIYVKEKPTFTNKISCQEVSIKGLPDSKIVESSEGEFLVETEHPELIVGGLSGTYVYSKDGKELGFIIELNGGKIRCLTIE